MDQKRSGKLLPFTQRARKPPKGLTSKVARDFFNAVMRDYTLENHHHTLLVEACFALQRADSAREQVARDGQTLLDERTGRVYAHPMVVAERDARALFLRATRELGLDLAEPEGPARRCAVAVRAAGGKRCHA